MRINRKLTDREQHLLQILAIEKDKAVKEIALLLNKDDHDVRTIVDSAADNVDYSAVEENKSTDWTLIKSYNERVKSIEDAIFSLARGEYGFCRRCSQPISEKRLNALPFAHYCITCQKEMEEMGK
ncbi:MAG: TraR/DksA family transcriptional regulator [bacterium]